MKQSEKLKNEANALKSCANDLDSFIIKVRELYEQYKGDDLEKYSVEETMKHACHKMLQSAELLEELSSSERTTTTISRGDAAILSYLRSNTENFRKQNDQLSAVLGELVKKLDLDGTGIDIYLLHYISDAMETFRALIEEIKGIEYND